MSTIEEGYFDHITEHPEISFQDVSIIRRSCPKADWVLDIGCGRGGFVKAAGRELPRALGLDNQPQAGRICHDQGVPFVLADAQRLPFLTGSIDVVRAKEIIEHLPDSRQMLSEIKRILRPGGLLLAHVPSQFSALYPVGNFWDDYTHVRPLSRSGLYRLLSDTGFAVDSIRGYTAGRNTFERTLGRALSLVAPHTWRAVSTREAA
jgi:SAM-dependent methyltransferase